MRQDFRESGCLATSLYLNPLSHVSTAILSTSFYRKLKFFRDRYITIEGQAVHGFSIVGQATKKLARWRLIIDYEVDGVRRSLLVDNNGRPFATSGEPDIAFKERLSWAWWLGEDSRFVPFGWYPETD